MYEEYNFIDKNGIFMIIGETITEVSEIVDGFSIIKRYDSYIKRTMENNYSYPLYNILTREGKLLSDEWFKLVHYFIGDVAWVQKDDNSEWFIDKNGKLYKCDEWYRDINGKLKRIEHGRI